MTGSGAFTFKVVHSQLWQARPVVGRRPHFLLSSLSPQGCRVSSKHGSWPFPEQGSQNVFHALATKASFCHCHSVFLLAQVNPVQDGSNCTKVWITGSKKIGGHFRGCLLQYLHLLVLYLYFTSIHLVYLSICLPSIRNSVFIPINSNSIQHHRIHTSFCPFCDRMSTDSHYSHIFSMYLLIWSLLLHVTHLLAPCLATSTLWENAPSPSIWALSLCRVTAASPPTHPTWTICSLRPHLMAFELSHSGSYSILFRKEAK